VSDLSSAQELLLKAGAAVYATLIAAPSHTKNRLQLKTIFTVEPVNGVPYPWKDAGLGAPKKRARASKAPKTAPCGVGKGRKCRQRESKRHLMNMSKRPARSAKRY
jgi:hypothetical protein